MSPQYLWNHITRLHFEAPAEIGTAVPGASMLSTELYRLPTKGQLFKLKFFFFNLQLVNGGSPFALQIIICGVILSLRLLKVSTVLSIN
jgi:hypothetical protein